MCVVSCIEKEDVIIYKALGLTEYGIQDSIYLSKIKELDGFLAFQGIAMRISYGDDFTMSRIREIRFGNHRS